ncbi:MAG: AarF/ABC1/UbiB kinase family protein [Deltaproteobacteria bacterium]|nr:AarF/ABC1/UbiB kinase family protein [Deltaproteobacteria bacterium]
MKTRYRDSRVARFRSLKAYFVAVLVIGSYLWLALKKKIFGGFLSKNSYTKTHRKNARRIEKVVLELKGLYIKVGQLFSIMTNILPDEYREHLEKLQDAVPPRPYSEIETRLKKELGQNLEDRFNEIQEKPIASASIAQVHLATTKNNEKVAIKVQYPGIEKIIRQDLKTLRGILSMVERLLPDYGLEHVYKEVRQIILQELDFKSEGENLECISSNFKNMEEFAFPRVYWDLTTKKVLVTEYLPGIKVSDIMKLDKEGIDRKQLARTIVRGYCKQIFLDGCFHGDPHPGNLIVRKSGEDSFKLVMVDFGCIGHLSDKVRKGIQEFVEGVIQRDGSKIQHAIKTVGFMAKKGDPKVFERVVRYYLTKFEGFESRSLEEIKLDPQKGLGDLRALDDLGIGISELTRSFNVPKDWVVLERTLLLAMGLCTRLDPSMNPVTAIEPYFTEFVLGKNKDWSEFLMETAKNVGMSSLSLPGDLRRFLERALSGEMEINITGLEKRNKAILIAARQGLYAFLAVSCAGFGAYYDHLSAGNIYASISWTLSTTFGLLLFFSLLKNRLR